MKKLLSLLSVLTISGTAVPTTIAASPYQKEKKININKREIKKDIEFTCSGDNFFTKRRITGIFSPNSWEKIIDNYNNNTFNKFGYIRTNDKSGLIDQAISQSNIEINDCSAPSISFSYIIRDNWKKINDVWNKSNRTSKMKITIAASGVFQNGYSVIESLDIINDDGIYANDYLSKFNDDFNNQKQKRSLNNNNNNNNNNNKIIDLGIIDDDSNNCILNKLKVLKPRLDISQFEVIEKNEHSFFNKNFLIKIRVKNSSNIYPIGLEKQLSFISRKFLQEDLPRLIDNENLIKNWESNFINWQTEINRQIDEDLSNYGKDNNGIINIPTHNSLVRTWKGNNINELKNKLLSLSTILETIDSKFKINELYNKVKNLEKDINNLKLQINELNQKISEIKNSLDKNKALEQCTNIGGFISASTGLIPYIGTLVSAVSGTVAAICTIVNA